MTSENKNVTDAMNKNSKYLLKKTLDKHYLAISVKLQFEQIYGWDKTYN